MKRFKIMQYSAMTIPMRFLAAAAAVFLICMPAAIAQHSARGTAAPVGTLASGKSAAIRTWWKDAVIYEIYPRSFQDSNGDGVGDLQGIIERLDYLKGLGVNTLWLTPIYPSPQVDFGYDISNYEAIDPRYGTMKDFDRLVAEAKKRGIRIVMDAVLNHTSDQNPWFLQSRASRTNSKRDWYVWRDGKADSVPPNNWISLFGHSAWQWDATTQQWYYHRFYKQQPDLNWRNPAVENAMFNSLRFWLDKGVAGFRLDAVFDLFEDPQLRDSGAIAGKNTYGDQNLDSTNVSNMPEVHDVLRRLRSMTNTYSGNRVLIGEVYTKSVDDLRKMYGVHHDELQLPMDMQVGFINKLDAGLFRQHILEAETEIDGNQPLLTLDNHDNPRSWDRYGDGVHNDAIARMLAVVLLTTRATPMLYYGEELGMVTTDPTRKEDVKDPNGLLNWPTEKGRDGERTPMQWNAGVNAGFTTGATPWLPVPSSAALANVQTESANANSMLNWHKKLIALRKTVPVLRNGGFKMLQGNSGDVVAYERTGTGASVVVACNFSAKPVTFSLAGELKARSVKTLAQSGGATTATPVSLEKIDLPPYGSWAGEIR
ncbi:MAG TPA: alpha-glucosidase [Acidobacteriaceae bacterium]